jgi:hypothetical protein
LKFAILNDTHAGVRGDMDAMADYQERFYSEIFFPYLEEHDIKHIVHLGDYFDRRKYVNFKSLKRNIEHFVKPMVERGITMDLILGIHDVFYRNTNEVNAPELLLLSHQNINVISEPVTKEFDGFDVALVPWINPENYADSIDFLKSTTASWAMGHFEIEGALVMPGHACHHGLSLSHLKRFEKVLSGHFHLKSEIGNVRYLGSQMQFTWSDYGDKKYFHIFDTQDQSVTPVENPLTMFEKFMYDDTKETFESLSEMDYGRFKSKFVKVVVVNKDNPYWFDTFIDKLHASTPLHVSVVDDHKHMDTMGDDEIENVEDTQTIIRKYIDSLEVQGDKQFLEDLVVELYNEALDEHTYT